MTDATVNRELSILRTAFHNGRKITPPKVYLAPYFPIKKETTIRKGFLADGTYAKLRDELPRELTALFVCDYVTASAGASCSRSSGIRLTSTPN